MLKPDSRRPLPVFLALLASLSLLTAGCDGLDKLIQPGVQPGTSPSDPQTAAPSDSGIRVDGEIQGQIKSPSRPPQNVLGSTVSYESRSFVLNFGTTGSIMRGRQYQIYAGAGVQSFTLYFDGIFSNQLDAADGVKVFAGVANQLQQRVTTAGTEVTVIGDRALLELNWNGVGTMNANVKIKRVTYFNAPASALPLRTSIPLVTEVDKLPDSKVSIAPGSLVSGFPTRQPLPVQMAESSSSFELKANEAVDLLTPAAEACGDCPTLAGHVYHLSFNSDRQPLFLNAANNWEYTLAVDGPAEVLINRANSGKGYPDPNAPELADGRVNTRGMVRPAGSPTWVAQDDTSSNREYGGQVFHVQDLPQGLWNDKWLMTVRIRPGNKGRHIRLSVNRGEKRFGVLKFRFHGKESDFVATSGQGIYGHMGEVMNETARVLYQASAGRIVLPAYKMIVGSAHQPLEKIDVEVFSGSQRADDERLHNVFPKVAVNGPVRIDPGPDSLISLDQTWWKQTPRQAGRTLAHMLLHHLAPIPDEFPETRDLGVSGTLPSPDLCPISLMSRDIVNAQELCWSGNHNPSGNADLRDRSTGYSLSGAQGPNRSMWELLSLPTIDRHPPQLLKDLNNNPHSEPISFYWFMKQDYAAPDNSPPVVLPPPPCLIVGVGTC